MNADGSNPVRLTDDAADDDEPSWSPDGTRIALTSHRGSNQVRVTDITAEDSVPWWSPDGSQIAFHSTRAGNLEIHVMNANGSGPVNLTKDPEADVGPAWSPQ